MMRVLFVFQAALQFLVGIGAAISGVLLMIAPSGAILHTPPEMLKDAPFDDFLVPGLILFAVNGIGQLVAAALTIRRHRSAGYAGAVFGMGLMIWIFVQVNMIGGRHILQYSYFFVGAVETALSFLIQKHLLQTGSHRSP